MKSIMYEPDIDLASPYMGAFVPLAPPPAFLSCTTDPVLLDQNAIDMLMQQGFPRGLAEELGKSKGTFPMRYWVVDNSGSMQTCDGRRILGTRDNIKVINCSRWVELQDSVEYHAQLAGLIKAPTNFRLLNNHGMKVGPQEFSVALNRTNIERDVNEAKSIIHRDEPDGVTPLTEHLRELFARIKPMEATLRDQGQKVGVVIATDGLPSDHMGISSDAVNDKFVEALRAIQTLPVWVVIRLCTNDDNVVQYYNDLDKILESPLEVLDDFFGEGKEIRSANPWVNYGLPLHRCREMGYHHRVFDLLDERLLSKDELLEFLKLLFGETAFSRAPDAHTDWKRFCDYLGKIVRKQGKQWNPATKKVDYWVDMKMLKKLYTEYHGCGLFRR